MCGIFGGIKNVKSEHLKLLGVLNEDRGTDATGLFDIDTHLKKAQSFRQFVLSDTSDFIKTFNKYLVGHTRFATTGQKTDRNAHPFECGKIQGVHNGVISNFELLRNQYQLNDLECDSEILFYLLDTKGIEGLKEVTGYYTIVWHDTTKPNKLFIINHSCTLAYTRGKDYFYFCSDSEDLEITLGYDSKIIEIDENTLYEIDVDTLKITKTKIHGLDSYSKRVAEKYKYKPTYNDNFSWEQNEYYKQWKDEPKIPQSAREYTIICPYCSEGLYVDEVQKGSCCYCHTQLTGIIYSCFHCESLVLLEQIPNDEKCPVCNLHLNLDDHYLVRF